MWYCTKGKSIEILKVLLTKICRNHSHWNKIRSVTVLPGGGGLADRTCGSIQDSSGSENFCNGLIPLPMMFHKFLRNLCHYVMKHSSWLGNCLGSIKSEKRRQRNYNLLWELKVTEFRSYSVYEDEWIQSWTELNFYCLNSYIHLAFAPRSCSQTFVSGQNFKSKVKGRPVIHNY